jgi:ABC-type sugar transport system ATPase subunit
MITLRDLACTAGGFRLGKISFSVGPGEYFVVLGPTGAGKTVLLETIAGLHRNPPGSVWIDGRDVSSWMPEERNIGYVPQDYALFPFLSVRENVLFPLRVRGRRGREAAAHVDEIFRLLKIGRLLDRGTRDLSGGEKQRVALARALAIRPRLLLLDEPFAALHAGFRRRLWMEMRQLHRHLHTTVIHVTHDLEEAFTLGQRAAVLIDGRLEQIGSKSEVLREPRNENVADFLGIMNVFSGEVAEIDSGRSTVWIRSKDYEFAAPLRQALSVGDQVGFCVHPEEIRVVPSGPPPTGRSDRTRLRARLVTAVSHGTARVLYFKLPHSSCKCGEYDLEVRLPAGQDGAVLPGEGEEATLTVGKDAVHVFRQLGG